MTVLDSTDWQILKLLQRQGRMPISELAQEVCRSESACHRRIRRLEADGVIESYTAVLNQAAIGRAINIFVEITLARQSEDSIEAFEAAVRNCPAVMSCHFMSGKADYLLHVAVSDTSDYEHVYKSYLSRFPSVDRIHSSFALRTVCKQSAFV